MQITPRRAEYLLLLPAKPVQLHFSRWVREEQTSSLALTKCSLTGAVTSEMFLNGQREPLLVDLLFWLTNRQNLAPQEG